MNGTLPVPSWSSLNLSGLSKKQARQKGIQCEEIERLHEEKSIRPADRTWVG